MSTARLGPTRRTLVNCRRWITAPPVGRQQPSDSSVYVVDATESRLRYAVRRARAHRLHTTTWSVYNDGVGFYSPGNACWLSSNLRFGLNHSGIFADTAKSLVISLPFNTIKHNIEPDLMFKFLWSLVICLNNGGSFLKKVCKMEVIDRYDSLSLFYKFLFHWSQIGGCVVQNNVFESSWDSVASETCTTSDNIILSRDRRLQQNLEVRFTLILIYLPCVNDFFSPPPNLRDEHYSTKGLRGAGYRY